MGAMKAREQAACVQTRLPVPEVASRPFHKASSKHCKQQVFNQIGAQIHNLKCRNKKFHARRGRGCMPMSEIYAIHPKGTNLGIRNTFQISTQHEASISQRKRNSAIKHNKELKKQDEQARNVGAACENASSGSPHTCERVPAALMPDVALVELPPQKGDLSSTNTRPPACTTECAADMPAKPPPKTMTCCAMSFSFGGSVVCA